MDTQHEVVKILDEVLGLEGRGQALTSDAALLGALPELDSLSVVALITRLEEHFSLAFAYDEIEQSKFATLGALTDFVKDKLGELCRVREVMAFAFCGILTAMCLG